MRKTEYSIGSLLVVIIAILCILLLKQCNDTKVYKGRYQTISALNDSIRVVKIKKDTLYQKEVITLPPKEVLKMVIKDTSTKKFLFELSKQKDLVAAMRIALQGKDSIITELAKDNSAIGDNNELKKTTKKSQWWWIFIAGFLSAHLLRFALQRFKVI